MRWYDSDHILLADTYADDESIHKTIYKILNVKHDPSGQEIKELGAASIPYLKELRAAEEESINNKVELCRYS